MVESGGAAAGFAARERRTFPPWTGCSPGRSTTTPVARWACPRDELRPWMLGRFHAARDRQILRAGEIRMSAGFRVTEEVRLPRGPRLWLMWRDAR